MELKSSPFGGRYNRFSPSSSGLSHIVDNPDHSQLPSSSTDTGNLQVSVDNVEEFVEPPLSAKVNEVSTPMSPTSPLTKYKSLTFREKLAQHRKDLAEAAARASV